MTSGSITIWFTGLPCSGKTTLALALERALMQRDVNVFSIDGDELRKGMNKDLGFSEADRTENIRRAAALAKKLMMKHSVILASFVSPSAGDRQMAREIIGVDSFIEVFVDCPLEVCEQRDVKGMYRKARAGEMKNFTGIHSPYETPRTAEIVIDTNQPLERSLAELENALRPYLKA